MNIKEDVKLATIQSKYKKYCKYCGHTITFFAFERDRKICSWCGIYNYKNQQIEFKDMLNKKIRRIKNEQ